MSAHWHITMKLTFTADWLTLPQQAAELALGHIQLLEQDPSPDGHPERILYEDSKPPLYSIGCDDYHLLYTYEQSHITLLTIRKHISPLSAQDLPETITSELLTNLHIPTQHHQMLLTMQTRNDLLYNTSLPTSTLQKIVAYLFPRPIAEVQQEAEYILAATDDLQRYRHGELAGFLLKLSPEQEKYSHWSTQDRGATLLKGGPGTGKSIIAFYRVRAFIQTMKEQGKAQPRVLFATYTKALAQYSQQLLSELLGEDFTFVRVQTADSMARYLLKRQQELTHILDPQEAMQLVQQAINTALNRNNSELSRNQRSLLYKLSGMYIQQEFEQVIISRQITSLENYLKDARPGRKVRLNAGDRQAIWHVYSIYTELLEQQGTMTWAHVRVRAEQCLQQKQIHPMYDAVIIDEAQDLDSNSLRFLVLLCRNPNNVLITADLNQAVYGNRVSWADINESVHFKARTALLQTNYRSSQRISKAAYAYLQITTPTQALEQQTCLIQGHYPRVTKADNEEEELQQILHFFARAARHYQLALTTCAILCPTRSAGERLAAGLACKNINAAYVSTGAIDPEQPGIKIIPIRSAKGLEFPIVAIAGLLDYHHPRGDLGENVERILNYRQMLFVGMTRATHELLIITPGKWQPMICQGLGSQGYWYTEKRTSLG